MVSDVSTFDNCDSYTIILFIDLIMADLCFRFEVHNRGNVPGDNALLILLSLEVGQRPDILSGDGGRYSLSHHHLALPHQINERSHTFT